MEALEAANLHVPLLLADDALPDAKPTRPPDGDNPILCAYMFDPSGASGVGAHAKLRSPLRQAWQRC